MLQRVLDVNTRLNEIVWGVPMVVAIIGVGVLLMAATGFVQFRRFGAMLHETLLRKKKDRAEGDISPFAALSTALAGTVGVGNIAGVATAIAMGGPGAIFWMWVSGLVGMGTKFSEVTLGVAYRARQASGPMVGGPMMYIERGMGPRFKFLAVIFAAMGALAAFGIGNMTQANAVAEGLAKFGVPRGVTGAALLLAVGLVTVGGVQRIARVAVLFVPFMCGLYFLGAVIIIAVNIQRVPECLLLILRSAVTPVAAAGGFAGAAVRTAMRSGIARGVFSNEAGLGSASIAHATARTDHPVRQGLWGILEVFIDTVVMCTVTALAILVTGAWQSDKTGADLTMSAFETVFGTQVGYSIVALSMALTAYDTMLAWGFYGETCSAYLFGPRARWVYRILWLGPILVGAVGALEAVWALADTLNGLMAIPNLIALVALSPVVFRLTREFFAKSQMVQLSPAVDSCN